MLGMVCQYRFIRHSMGLKIGSDREVWLWRNAIAQTPKFALGYQIAQLARGGEWVLVPPDAPHPWTASLA